MACMIHIYYRFVYNGLEKAERSYDPPRARHFKHHPSTQKKKVRREAAYQGDFGLVQELNGLFARPFDEQPEFEATRENERSCSPRARGVYQWRFPRKIRRPEILM